MYSDLESFYAPSNLRFLYTVVDLDEREAIERP